MRILYRGLILWLGVCLTLQAYPPRLAFAGLPGQSSQKKPNIISSAEENYNAAGDVDHIDKGDHKLLWTILAVVAIGAAFGIGGGGGGRSQSGTAEGDGTISAGW